MNLIGDFMLNKLRDIICSWCKAKTEVKRPEKTRDVTPYEKDEK